MLYALTDSLKADSRISPEGVDFERPEQWLDLLQSPATELRGILLEHLVDPMHIGCGHIRLMLQHGESYGIRRELVLSFLRAFFELWWEGSPELDLTLLPGDHRDEPRPLRRDPSRSAGAAHGGRGEPLHPGVLRAREGPP